MAVLNQDVSVKLLNHSNNNSGFLEIFTEINHNFKINDYIFIIGGIYDNTSDLSYISSYNSSPENEITKPFNKYRKGYRIRSINNIQNSITLDIPISGNAVSPYGSGTFNKDTDTYTNADNYKGNPLYHFTISPPNDDYKAYNYLDSDLDSGDMYKGIYISKIAINKGRIYSGIINNGVLGSDNFEVKLNADISPNINSITINHFISKNTIINKGNIYSKTDAQAPNTVRFKVNENNSGANTVSSVSTSDNNNNLGWNNFEKVIANAGTNINRGLINNPNPNAIILNQVNLSNNVRLGATSIYTPLNSNIINDCNISGASIGYITGTGSNTLTSANINTIFPLNPTAINLEASPGQITFTVSPDIISNKIWNFTEDIIIMGMFSAIPTPQGRNKVYIDDNDKTTSELYDKLRFSMGKIVNVSYNYGNATANITLEFDRLIPVWSDILSMGSNNITYSDLRISFINNINNDSDINISNSVVSAFIDASINGSWNSTTTGNNNMTYGPGFYNGIVYNSKGTIFQGIDYHLSAHLCNSFQMNQYGNSGIGANVNDSTYNFTNIYTASVISGTFNKVNIYSGIIQNATISDGYIKSRINDFLLFPEIIYLYNSNVSGGIIIDDNVYWDNINYNGAKDTLTSNGYIISVARLGQRKVAWTTHPTYTSFTGSNFNKIELTTIINKYNSQSILSEDNTLIYEAPSIRKIYDTGDIPNYSLDYDIHPIKNQNNDEKIFISITDKGKAEYTGMWNITSARNNVLFADVIDNNAEVNDAISNRTEISTPTNENANFTRSGDSGNIQNIMGVPDEFLIEYPNFYANSQFFDGREQNSYQVNIYDEYTIKNHALYTLKGLANTYPDPLYENTVIPYLKIQNFSGGLYANGIPENAEYSINGLGFSQYLELYFCHTGSMLNHIINIDGDYYDVPKLTDKCIQTFIEIERVITESFNINNDPDEIKATKIYNVSFNTANPYNDNVYNDTHIEAYEFPQEIFLQSSSLNQFGQYSILIDINSHIYNVIYVEYWITYYTTFGTSALPLDITEETDVGGVFTSSFFQGLQQKGYREKKIAKFILKN